ncbi:methylmalonyl Co-A mutase-associated GTPase MeaB [Anoxybacillus rupiensis]|jgi:LAO/AO transport system kinase|uniref:Methylmalonyl Co-A mutase-associated GTPase MeaB n=1 Tax=Anoxybacteroides rupiense TaxID=311460 RepID=A0ABD5IS97_9BACL|nr:methylmalonyl Co-A mutase-associated GTPase MeaB [Anoxybacillus rupiensis]MDE8562511.1 methylmalonyl Co-A mutase-associated GTPase MeaB [Anoxybacillus rupiensis]MED5050758.1 methylmalonyl Co-A mutase-associated GTPase MeaB [Anoxybacillus rupiensis]
MNEERTYRPEWAPKEQTADFATAYVKGKEDTTLRSQETKKWVKRKERSVSEYVEGVLNNDRTILAQAITLVESNAAKHMERAQQILHELLPHVGRSIRIGITGVPGAGKSTFIEAFGQFLCEQGHRVAVLAVDPSSSITGGSILGDKTRMENLARDPRAFIRPSPSGGTLGGVHRKTRETMLLCEAAGYDIILIETVGVGQSEFVVRSMVDFFMMIALTGAGDELQGMKKGIMELVDAVVINKADGDNKPKAEAAREEYNQFLHYLRPATPGWETKAYTCSALLGEGIEKVWNVVEAFISVTKQSGAFDARRRHQLKDWIYSMIKDYLESSFFSHPQIKAELPMIENHVIAGTLSVTKAVQQLLQIYETKKGSE